MFPCRQAKRLPYNQTKMRKYISAHNRERSRAVDHTVRQIHDDYPLFGRRRLASTEHGAPASARLRRGRRAREGAEVHLFDASRGSNRSSGKLSEMRDETRACGRKETPNVQRRKGAWRPRRFTRSTSNVQLVRRSFSEGGSVPYVSRGWRARATSTATSHGNAFHHRSR